METTIAPENGDFPLDGTMEMYTDEVENVTNETDGQNLFNVTYYSLHYQVVATILYLVVGIAAVVGNMMVILVVLRVPHMRTPTNCYLVSLALCDAITGLVTVLLHSVSENLIPTGTFIGGVTLCYIIVPLEYITFNVSALSITAFTVERYIAICHPMKAKLICSVSRASKIIIGLWIFGIGYSILYIIIIKYDYILGNDDNFYHRCWYKENPKLIQIVYLSDVALYYVLPVGLSCILYGLIGRVLFKSTKMSSNMQSGYEPVPLKSKNENGNFANSKKLKKKKEKPIKDNTVSSRKQVSMTKLNIQ